MLSDEQLKERVARPLSGVDLPELGPRHRGKVRDAYQLGGNRLLITTDRISAFDRVLGVIPYKGQVLNQLSNWWFARTGEVVANHLLEEWHPNASLVRQAEPLPIEVVVRGYITGVTKTSLWTNYNLGKDPYGLGLAPGLNKNDKLPQNVITPTSKGESDQPLSADQIVERGLLPAKLWSQVQEVALELFTRGQQVAAKAGLILVDTKYEFGLVDGQLTLIDEVHTPDSSRYWVAGSEHLEKPKHQDKEVLRLWLAETGFSGQAEAPELPLERALGLARHYIETYEMLTGIPLQACEIDVEQAVRRHLAVGGRA